MPAGRPQRHRPPNDALRSPKGAATVTILAPPPTEGATAPPGYAMAVWGSLCRALLGRQRQPVPVQQAQRTLGRLELLGISVEPVLLDRRHERTAARTEIDVGIVDGRRHLLLVHQLLRGLQQALAGDGYHAVRRGEVLE